MPEGLYQKYAVRRLDGEWDSGSEYFVLDVGMRRASEAGIPVIDYDPAARHG